MMDDELDMELAENISMQIALTRFLDNQEDPSGEYDTDLLITLCDLDKEGIITAFLNLTRIVRRTINLWAGLCAIEEEEDEREVAIVHTSILQGFMKGYEFRNKGGKLE